MTSVRADDIPIADDEPFGMNGVLSWLKPLLSMCCAIGAVACLFMSASSQKQLIGVTRDAPNMQIWVESLFGRLQFQIADGNPLTTTTDYIPNTFTLGGYLDRWPESWQKTIGVEWGDAVRGRGGSRRGATPVWQLRLRWRTIAGVLAVPPVVSLINATRRRRRLLRGEMDAVA